MKMHLDKIYFDNIKNKVKIYETRVYDKKRQEIKLLEEIVFLERNSKKKIKAKVVELSYFSNFRDAIKDVGVKKVLPNAKSLNDAIKIYEKFPHEEGSYKEGAKKYGVLRIKFK